MCSRFEVEDSVDQIIQGWESALPHLDPSPLHVFSRISRIAQRLDDARREAFTLHNLQGWEFDVLSALRRSGPPFELTPGALIEQTHVTSGTMTNRITRLIDRSYVSRRSSQHDGRVVLVQLTAHGRSAVESAFATLLNTERALLSGAGECQKELTKPLRSLLLALERTPPAEG